MTTEKDPEIVCIQLQNLENAYKHTQKGVLAYTVRNFLRMAIEYGKPQHVLDDPVFQTLFMDARLATDCGWRAGFGTQQGYNYYTMNP
jgi:hypothetical protein